MIGGAPVLIPNSYTEVVFNKGSTVPLFFLSPASQNEKGTVEFATVCPSVCLSVHFVRNIGGIESGNGEWISTCCDRFLQSSPVCPLPVGITDV